MHGRTTIKNGWGKLRIKERKWYSRKHAAVIPNNLK
jgi:hypothetical protein